LKTIKKTVHSDFGDDSAKDHMTKLLQAYEQVSTSFTIRDAFRRSEFTAEVRSKPIWLVFNKGILRQNPGFPEIWNFNISVDQLSKRRRSQGFGILNADFLARCSDEETAFAAFLMSRDPAMLSSSPSETSHFSTIEKNNRNDFA
jgi:hypothetical protein